MDCIADSLEGTGGIILNWSWSPFAKKSQLDVFFVNTVIFMSTRVNFTRYMFLCRFQKVSCAMWVHI